MNLKLDKYLLFKEKLFFVVVGESFSQADLDAYAVKKIKALPLNSQMVTIDSLKNVLDTMKSYPDPLK